MPKMMLAVGIPPWQVRGVRKHPQKAEQTGGVGVFVCVRVPVADLPCLCVPTAARGTLHPALLGCTVRSTCCLSAPLCVLVLLGIQFGQPLTGNCLDESGGTFPGGRAGSGSAGSLPPAGAFGAVPWVPLLRDFPR